MFKITEIKIKKIATEDDSKLIGVAKIVIDNSFAISDIRIVKRDDNSLFVAFPSRKQLSGEYKDICHPINHTTREMFENVILSEFKKYDKNDSRG